MDSPRRELSWTGLNIDLRWKYDGFMRKIHFYNGKYHGFHGKYPGFHGIYHGIHDDDGRPP